MTRRFKPPIYATTNGAIRSWHLNIGADELSVINHLLGELRSLLAASDEDAAATSPLLKRLFPPVYTDDEEKEREYQRLMREDLVASRTVQIDAVLEILAETQGQGSKQSPTMDEGRVVALMQSLNAVRIVLGTLLDVGEDDDVGTGTEGDEYQAERELYGYLSWLLEWTVRSLSDA